MISWLRWSCGWPDQNAFISPRPDVVWVAYRGSGGGLQREGCRVSSGESGRKWVSIHTIRRKWILCTSSESGLKLEKQSSLEMMMVMIILKKSQNRDVWSALFLAHLSELWGYRGEGQACFRSTCEATRCAACITGEVRVQTATSSDGLRTAGEHGHFRRADLTPIRAHRPFEVSLRAAIASELRPKPRGVFTFLHSRAEQGSHDRHETEPQEWAESRVSISVWPIHMQQHSDQNHFTGLEINEGWDEWWRERGEGCPCNIWALMHSSVMAHNLLIPLQTAGEREGRYMKGRGIKKENTRMINSKERRGRK